MRSADLPSLAQVQAELARRRLADYVEATSRLRLHRWQREHLCPALDELGRGKGLRLLIHAPPQFGKSIVLTKRMPAQKLGRDPLLRIGVAAYSTAHATRLTHAIRETMRSAAHLSIFPDPLGHVREPSSEGEFSTHARSALNEAQASVSAYGLNGGFTGNGVDLLLVDDPYASPDEARSEAVNEKVWRWWDELASVRLDDATDVVYMFHRYHPNDIAGRLKATGRWRSLRFPALGDENEEADDPTRLWRGYGEPLSPIRSMAFLEDQKAKSPMTWAGQFQGRPQSEEGKVFTESMFETVDRMPELAFWIRAWDPASSVKETNDHTASALVGIDSDGSLCIADVTRWRRTWPETRDGRWSGGRPYEASSTLIEPGIVQTIQADFARLGREDEDRATYLVGFARKGMGLPMVQDLQSNPEFLRIPLFPIEEKGDKRQRAQVWAARGAIRPIRLLRGPWTEGFKSRCLAFQGDGTSDDDEQDAVSVAMSLLYLHTGGKLEAGKRPQIGSPEYNRQLGKRDDDWDD